MGHTFKDRNVEFRQDSSMSRYYRGMDHFKKNVKKANITTCGKYNKVSFPTERAAQARADEILSEGARDTSYFRIYQCDYCQKWHLTTKVDQVGFGHESNKSVNVTANGDQGYSQEAPEAIHSCNSISEGV